MPHDLHLILTLTGGLTAALIPGFITRKMRLSPLVGYLVAGMCVGPHFPGFVADASTASHYAEIGIILLMFGVGLHFHLEDLLAVQKVALPGPWFTLRYLSVWARRSLTCSVGTGRQGPCSA